MAGLQAGGQAFGACYESSAGHAVARMISLPPAPVRLTAGQAATVATSTLTARQVCGTEGGFRLRVRSWLTLS